MADWITGQQDPGPRKGAKDSWGWDAAIAWGRHCCSHWLKTKQPPQWPSFWAGIPQKPGKAAQSQGNISHSPHQKSFQQVAMTRFGNYRNWLNGSCRVNFHNSPQFPGAPLIMMCPLLQLENSKAECARKDTEIYALRTQLDTLQKQSDDHQQHITVLREQISAKEQQAAMLQADVSGPWAEMEVTGSLLSGGGSYCIIVWLLTSVMGLCCWWDVVILRHLHFRSHWRCSLITWGLRDGKEGGMEMYAEITSCSGSASDPEGVQSIKIPLCDVRGSHDSYPC